VAFELTKRRTRRDFVHFFREFNTSRTRVRIAVKSNSQATSCSRLEPAPAERVTRNEEGTERQSARSLNSPLGTTSCFSASSQVPPIHTVC